MNCEISISLRTPSVLNSATFARSAAACPGIVYTAAFAAGERMRAEVYIDLGQGDQNKTIYDWLWARKNEIESATGQLEWERLDLKRASRISLVRHKTNIEDAVDQGGEMRSWLVQALLSMKATFGPLLTAAVKEIPSQLPPA
jgi:hypothetical protein